MIRAGWFAASILILVPWPCPAQFGGMGGIGGGGMGGRAMGMGMGVGPVATAGEEWTVKFETFDGQSVTGRLRLPSVGVACSLGLYEIKPEKIKAIEFKPATEPLVIYPGGVPREGTVLTGSGEKVVGKVNVPNWKVETELGTLTPDAQQLKTLTFIARADAAKPAAEAGKPNAGPSDDPTARKGGVSIKGLRHPDGESSKEAARPAEPPPVADPAKGPAKPGEPEKKPGAATPGDPPGA